jgi:membrane protease YdiL (CAAX protease family)
MSEVSVQGWRSDVRPALALGVAGAVSTVLLFPYLLATMPQVLQQARVPLPVLAALQAAQGLVLLSLLAFAGLRMGQRVGLGAPWLRARLAGVEAAPQAWGRAALLGMLAAVAIAGLAPLFDGLLPTPLQAPPAPSATHASLAGLLASFYGGIVEEVQLRLFLMTLVAWLLARVSGSRASWLFWVAILVAALLFGAGHLPAASKIWPLDAVVVARTLLLNGVGGVVFGWLYWRQGFESAVLGHFCADLVLHVATPLVVAGLA